MILKLAFQGNYDRLVLAAGDGDFEDAIAYVKDVLHKKIVVVGYHDSLSPDLQSYADEVIWLDDAWDKIRKEDAT